ncbi:MAG: hypothetical protein WHV67_10480, partial [Thermoanaerobaculia bacterium]
EYTVQDFLDLQVLYNLAWFDPDLRKKDSFLIYLVEKGKNFTEEEKLKVEKWEIDVYKWDGKIYKYDDKLSLNNQSKKMPSWVKKIEPEIFPFDKI